MFRPITSNSSSPEATCVDRHGLVPWRLTLVSTTGEHFQLLLDATGLSLKYLHKSARCLQARSYDTRSIIGISPYISTDYVKFWLPRSHLCRYLRDKPVASTSKRQV